MIFSRLKTENVGADRYQQPNLFLFPIRSVLRPDYSGIVGKNVALKFVLRPP